MVYRLPVPAPKKSRTPEIAIRSTTNDQQSTVDTSLQIATSTNTIVDSGCMQHKGILPMCIFATGSAIALVFVR